VREARRLVGEAAREIAAAPAAWAAVVDRARAAFGRPPLGPEAVSALGFPLLSAEDEGARRSSLSSSSSRSARGG
jgi:hypothetical protein